MDKLKKVLSGNDNQDDDSSTGIFSQFDTSLSWSTRIKYFAFCFVLGIVVSFIGALCLFLHKGLALFAVFYTLGNVISLASTCFLMGPYNQLQKMFSSSRVFATIIVIVMICLTFIAGLVMKNAALSLLFIILQWLAMTWYSLSYIPYARDVVRKTVSSCV